MGAETKLGALREILCRHIRAATTRRRPTRPNRKYYRDIKDEHDPDKESDHSVVTCVRPGRRVRSGRRAARGYQVASLEDRIVAAACRNSKRPRAQLSERAHCEELQAALSTADFDELRGRLGALSRKRAALLAAASEAGPLPGQRWRTLQRFPSLSAAAPPEVAAGWACDDGCAALALWEPFFPKGRWGVGCPQST